MNQISGTASRLHRVPQIAPITVKIVGKWQLESPNNNVSVLTTGNTTEVTFNTINGITIQTNLIPESTLSVMNMENKQESFKIYPNPSKEKLS